VPVGEDPEQDELERLALADDGTLDLGEDALRPARQLGKWSSTSKDAPDG
jgi:hypothetical protein